MLIWLITRHPSQTRELTTPPADRIREQDEQDPGRVAHTRQEAGSNDFLAVGPALQLSRATVNKRPTVKITSFACGGECPG